MTYYALLHLLERPTRKATKTRYRFEMNTFNLSSNCIMIAGANSCAPHAPLYIYKLSCARWRRRGFFSEPVELAGQKSLFTVSRPLL